MNAGGLTMAHKVFICHSSKDKPVADAACAALEAQRISCWIAPRDILAGIEYGDAIIEALSECQIVLLIFSQAANGSPQVRREIERAVSKEKIIVPFRIENVLPSNAMEFALSNTHWLDALTPPLERALSKLCETISRLLQRQQPVPAPEPVFGPPPKQPDVEPSAPETSIGSKRKTGSKGFPGWAWGALALLALVAVFAAGRLFGPHSQPLPSHEPSPQQLSEHASTPDANSNSAEARPPAAKLPRPAPAANSNPTDQKPDFQALGRQADALYTQKRYAEAAPLYEQLCNSGNTGDCGRVASMYNNGLDLPANIPRAMEFASKACDGGLADDCLTAAMDYEIGAGVPQNYSRALALYTKACNAGNAMGCRKENEMKRDGKGVANNGSRANVPSSKSAEDSANDFDKLLRGTDK